MFRPFPQILVHKYLQLYSKMMINVCARLRLPCHHGGLWTCVPSLSVHSWHINQHTTLRPSLHHLPHANKTQIQVLPQKMDFSSACNTSFHFGLTPNRARTCPILVTVDAFQHKSHLFCSKRGASQYVKGIRYLEKLMENEELYEEALKNGQFLVFYDLKVLDAMDSSGRMKLGWRGVDGKVISGSTCT